MRPKILEENIDNFNCVAEDAIKQLAKIIGYSGHDGEVPDLDGELKKWSTESEYILRAGRPVMGRNHVLCAYTL